VIAFGCAITDNDPYWRYAKPGIDRVAEADSAIYPFAAVGSTARSYNLLIDAAAARDDLEALVILHTHAEITDPGFCAKVRAAMSDPDVAIAGCIGARGAKSIAWWEGDVVSAPVTLRYNEFGSGETPAFAWTEPAPAPGEVDAVGGMLMVLSPWAVRNIRFDEELVFGPGIEVDLCRQAKAAGKKVVVADLKTTFHSSLELIEGRDIFIESHIRIARKWEGAAPTGGTDWRARARRAEAERESAHAASYALGLMTDAHLVELEREIEQAKASGSWRATEPLRRLNKWRAERRGGSATP